jgi:hypothetical protein
MEKILLEIAKQIIDKYKMIDEISGLNFNLLSSGNIDTKETFHSFLIADLLNPKGSHNQGDKFLNLFLKEIEFNKKLKSPSVYTEYPIKNNKVLNVHKLHYIRSVMKDEDIFKFIDSKIDLDIIKYPKNIQELYRYDNLETKKLKYLLNFILDNKTKDELINELFKQIADEKEFSQKLYMNIDDIKKLNSQGYLGTHTDLHLPLATLSKEDIKNDINNSLEFFYKDCAISNIDSISYPYWRYKSCK